MMRRAHEYLRLSWSDRGWVAEALAWLILFRWVLRWLPFRFIHQWLALPAVRPELRGDERARVRERVSDVVSFAVHRLGVEAVCFPRALAAHAMLRRRGIVTSLYYGARRLPESPHILHAHVWLADGDVGVVGYHAAAEHKLQVVACLTPHQDIGKGIGFYPQIGGNVL